MACFCANSSRIHKYTSQLLVPNLLLPVPMLFMAMANNITTAVFLAFLLCSFPSLDATRGGTPRRTDMHFYLHDIVLAPGATAVPVASASGNLTKFGFGSVFVIDDLLTRGPVRTSRVVGRAQGMYAWDSQEGYSLLLLFTCVFHSARYNGSTISIQGADRIDVQQREVAVVGGTGHFRYARGYALVETHSVYGLSVVLKFNVTILH